MQLHAIGFGSLNLDEFWEVDSGFLRDYAVVPGEEYVRDVAWFERAYRALADRGRMVTVDPGGSAANMIAALRRMGFETGFYGAAGRDDAAALRLDELGETENLRVRLTDVPSGRCLAMIDKGDPSRDRGLVILPNANDLAGADDPDVDYFSQSRWVHVTSFVARGPLEAQIKLVQALPSSVSVSFDPGAVYVPLGLTVLRPIIAKSAVLFTTREELESLAELPDIPEAAAKMLDEGTGMVVVKMGAQGLRAFSRSHAFHQPGVPPREMRDRTGAGDVAAAGFLAGLMHALDTQACLELAARAASASIEGYGRHAYPDRTFFERFLSSHM